MSVIIYGPQGCGKTRLSKVIAEHYGLKHIIDNGVDESGNCWSACDPVPDDTLVLTGEELVKNNMEHYGALDFFKVASEICLKECREDLERDLPGVIKELREEFSLRDVRVELGLIIKRDFIDDLIGDVLLSLGCTKLRKSYDGDTSWYLQPAPDNEDRYYHPLKSLLSSQKEPFSLDQVFERLFPYQKNDRHLQTIITKSLTKLGCQRFERRDDPTSRFWYRPPVSIEEMQS